MVRSIDEGRAPPRLRRAGDVNLGLASRDAGCAVLCGCAALCEGCGFSVCPCVALWGFD